VRSPDTRIARAIFVATCVVYLLSSGREPPWGDANVQYMVAESLVDHGGIDIRKPWPDDDPPRDGKFYSTYPLLPSLTQLPGLAILGAATAVSPPSRGLAKPLTTHLACSVFGALTCVLFFLLCRQRKLSTQTASIATAVLAFATTTWVYSHYSYSEIAQAAWFTGFVLYLLRTAEASTAKNARWLGLFAGLLFGFKYIYAATIVGGFGYLAWTLRSQRAVLVRLIVPVAIVAVPFVIMAMIYNYLTYGSPVSTGYNAYFDKYWGENPMSALWGMFLSPGKSVFLYSPPLILGLYALPRLVREHRSLCWIVLATAGPVIAIYSRYKLIGDYAWGPRFVVFAVPVLTFSFAVVLEAWRGAWTRWRRFVIATVIAGGVAVQLLGNALYWDHFIRISMDARAQWLGQPNRKGAIIPTRADGHCDSCFEDTHQLHWLPPFQPILGHWWLVRSLAADRTAAEAATDAPWRRHTSLDLNITTSYPRARLDWWGMLWIKDFPQTRVAGVILLVLLLAGSAFGVVLWIRAHRAGADPPSSFP
jgi:hypothetical protein